MREAIGRVTQGPCKPSRVAMSDTILNDGGPAFPIPPRTESDGVMSISHQGAPGMSLLDYYIGPALASPHDMVSLMNMAKATNRRPTQVLACVCCDWAEAVMAERERRYGKQPEPEAEVEGAAF
jgi:hypothetical protein